MNFILAALQSDIESYLTTVLEGSFFRFARAATIVVLWVQVYPKNWAHSGVIDTSTCQRCSVHAFTHQYQLPNKPNISIK